MAGSRMLSGPRRRCTAQARRQEDFLPAGSPAPEPTDGGTSTVYSYLLLILISLSPFLVTSAPDSLPAVCLRRYGVSCVFEKIFISSSLLQSLPFPLLLLFSPLSSLSSLVESFLLLAKNLPQSFVLRLGVFSVLPDRSSTHFHHRNSVLAYSSFGCDTV